MLRSPAATEQRVPLPARLSFQKLSQSRPIPSIWPHRQRVSQSPATALPMSASVYRWSTFISMVSAEPYLPRHAHLPPPAPLSPFLSPQLRGCSDHSRDSVPELLPLESKTKPERHKAGVT